MTGDRVGSSFRDPSGFLFSRDGTLYRQVEPSYAEDYEHLCSSGLYEALVRESLLIPHAEIDLSEAMRPGAFRVLRPERVPFVSFPYEWCFGQLRAAALLTLRVQILSMAHGMVLKDASAFNVQFRGSVPVFVDTLSFTRYLDGQPWVAYGQFCRHFLAPLALQALVDVRLRAFGRHHLDGVPLDLASKLLPMTTWLRPWALVHLHLHARSIKAFASTKARQRAVTTRRVSVSGLEGLCDHLMRAVSSLQWTPEGTEWGDYEQTHGYDAHAHELKRSIVTEFLRDAQPALVFDLGANTGEYSRLARSLGSRVVALDADAAAVELAYRRLSSEGEQGVLPLWVDLTNPSPAQGWALREWPSLFARGTADVVLALALVHHVAIGNNVPLADFATFLADLGRQAVVEWVPKEDPQVQRLLTSRTDIFAGYTEQAFTEAVSTHFRVKARRAVGDSGRVLFHLARDVR